jgi:hypothetical protein
MNISKSLPKDSPVYHRHSWDFFESTINFNDPSRYLGTGVNGGWGVGEIDNYYLETIKEILEIIIDYFKFEKNNILFYGSSQGGFLSVMLATKIRGTSAIAEIPQIDVRTWQSWSGIQKIIFPNYTEEDINERLKERLYLIEMFKKENYVPDMLLIFDCWDFDIKTQYLPFIKDLTQIPPIIGKATNNIKIIVRSIPKHESMTMEEFNKIKNNFYTLKDESSIYDKYLDLKKGIEYFDYNPEIIAPLIKYATARITIKNNGNSQNNIELTYNSDEKSIAKSPKWFINNKGTGIVINSFKGDLDLSFTCINDGELELTLRSISLKKNNIKIPIYINYTDLIVKPE